MLVISFVIAFAYLLPVGKSDMIGYWCIELNNKMTFLRIEKEKYQRFDIGESNDTLKYPISKWQFVKNHERIKFENFTLLPPGITKNGFGDANFPFKRNLKGEIYIIMSRDQGRFIEKCE